MVMCEWFMKHGLILLLVSIAGGALGTLMFVGGATAMWIVASR